jgi:hypothetical protein
MGEELLSQLTSSAVVIYAIEALKKSRWFPWLTAETTTVNRIAAVVGSLAAAVGIHYSYDMTAGALLITGLTPSGISHGIWHWAQQYAITQLAYDAAIDNKYRPKPGDLAITKQPAPPALVA